MTINHPAPPRKTLQRSTNIHENPRYHPEKFHNNSKSPTTNHKNSTTNFYLPPHPQNPTMTHYHPEKSYICPLSSRNSHNKQPTTANQKNPQRPITHRKSHNKALPSTTTQKNHRKIHTTKVNVTTTYYQLRKSYNDPLPSWKVPRKLAKSHLSNQI